MIQSSNPVFNANRMKIGIFCTNGRGNPGTTVPEARKLDWPTALETAKIADEAGYEAIVPFSRWKGYIPDQPNHMGGDVLDPYTFAAAIAQATKRVSVFVTSHSPTIHPILAAKQLATIDIISGGRAALNVVAGWNRPELEMFGAALREHDQRYDYLGEWLEIIERLWSSHDEFDFSGEFFKIVKGISLPKPIQQPRIPIMNAGGSPRGKEFACEHADLSFVIVKSENPESIRAEVSGYKQMARERFGRDVQVWTHTYVVQRDTQEQADEYVRYFAVEHQDRASVDGWIAMQVQEAQLMPPHVLEGLRIRVAAGGGGFPLVGTPQAIADRLQMLSSCGVDGVLLTWTDYVAGMTDFNREVMPRLEEVGLRLPTPAV